MSTEVKYLVQPADGRLYVYVRLDILLCDLATNRGEGVRIFRLKSLGRGRECFEPVTEDELRKEAA